MWTNTTSTDVMAIFRMYGPLLVYAASCGAPGINLADFLNTGNNRDEKASKGLAVVNGWRWGSEPQENRITYNKMNSKLRGKKQRPTNAVSVTDILKGNIGSSTTTTKTTTQSTILTEYRIAFSDNFNGDERIKALENIEITVDSNPLSDRWFGYLWYHGHLKRALQLFEIYDPRLGQATIFNYLQIMRECIEALREITWMYKDLIRQYRLKLECKNANMVQQIQNMNIIDSEATSEEISTIDTPLVEEKMQTPALTQAALDGCKTSAHRLGMYLFNVRMQVLSMVGLSDSWDGSTLMSFYSVMNGLQLETKNIMANLDSFKQMRKWCDEYKPPS